MKAVKLVRIAIVVAAAAVIARGPVASAADVSVGMEINSVDDFYTPLSTEGFWVDIGSYGRCWHPYGVAATWRPYCEGTWVWTDDGWYWQSDEPWGWACYHYGRWTLDSYYGWIWVPGVEWAPAWVCFREGGGYCGWAPLPPGWHGGAIEAGLVPDDWFVFVGEHHFAEHLHVRDLVANNPTIVRRTRMIARTRRTVDNRVIAEGPRVQDLQRVNRERIRTSTVTRLRAQEKAPRIVHEPVPSRENEQRIQPHETAPPEGESPRNHPPEIIRGAPTAPPPAAGEPERRAPPPPESPAPREPSPEPRQRIEQQPGEPRRDTGPPPKEERREEPHHEKDREEQGGGHE